MSNREYLVSRDYMKTENNNSNLDWMIHWSLTGHHPRNTQIKLINKINLAINEGYKNIILEAGTGIGKSAIATTLANMYDDSYILTMTKQLQKQYLDDFGEMLVEIKGKGNYKCNYKGNCDFCIRAEYNIARCSDCDYLIAFRKAKKSKNVITNYDFMYRVGVDNQMLDPRQLLILDEAHNLERKMLMLSSHLLNREYISTKFGIDIFEALMKGEKSYNHIKSESDYWIDVCKKLMKACGENIEKIGGKGKEVQVTLDEFESNPSKYSSIDYIEKQILESDLKEFNSIRLGLESKDLIIDVPDFKSIKKNKMDISAEFKPYSVSDATQNLLSFGETRIFLTGTLGDMKKFCQWNNINPDNTYYIYEKSPFDVSNRPIYRDFVGNMSGSRRNVPNWKNKRAISKIKQLIGKYPNQKGVIHTSSNEQAFWIMDNLKEYNLLFVGGESRNEVLKEFNESKDDAILIGASIKDGVDLKGDLCRFQIVFKVPYPQLNEQVKYRKSLDPSWYYYQAVMAIMQAYGRGIRDKEDYCDMYIIDSNFKKLFDYNYNFFNEYFTEALKNK
ncbi:helicase C-terminal domain-containing protein [uncultured Methanobrevibacter sp.]|uniref:helicase C-terminal domain-containing protein n=1 Tax=uncultured Methanobrevibacter sp. TaxID=253161 RepID=UPI0025F257D6|nr:helicase C-terminal domain-containing protein [uncultured Methanobrevibacter sp.]